MTKTAATINAFAVASIAPAVFLASAEVVRIGDVVGFALVLVLLPFSIMATILLAVPVFLLLNWLHCVNLWSILIGGIVIGAVVATILRLPNAPVASDLPVMCAAGLFSAFSFWLVRRILERKRADGEMVERAP